MRFAFIHSLRDAHPIATLCRMMQVARSGDHAWAMRKECARGLPTPRTTSTQIWAFQAMQALGALAIDQPALAAQPHMDLWRSQARALRGELLDPHPQPLRGRT